RTAAEQSGRRLFWSLAVARRATLSGQSRGRSIRGVRGRKDDAATDWDGCVVSVFRNAAHADAHRLDTNLRPSLVTRRRTRLQDHPQIHRRATARRAHVPPEARQRTVRRRPSVLDRRQRLRSRIPRPTHPAAATRRLAAAVYPSGAAAFAAARPVETVVGIHG